MVKYSLLFLVLLCSCSEQDKVGVKTEGQEKGTFTNTSRINKYDSVSNVVKETSTGNHKKNLGPVYSYKVIFEENVGWGYQIYSGSKMLINQTHIPAIQGIKGFSTKEKAEKTADYVLKQVVRGNFPPTLSETILDSLDVL